MKIHNFGGDLTDISAKKEALLQIVEAAVLSLDYSRADWLWANAVVHTRCFVYGPQQAHMTCPGIDMANHSFRPNAAVRVRPSPNQAPDFEEAFQVSLLLRHPGTAKTCIDNENI